MRRVVLSFGWWMVCPVVVLAAPDTPAPPSDLVDYVTKKDDSFSWKLVDTKKTDAGTIYELDLISQTWHEIRWDHKLLVIVPKDAKPQATMLLWNQGGRPNPTSNILGLQIAERVKAPVAFLFGVPKQPLFGGKTEDALIAETFVRYLESQDGSWPLLFPMVKSVVAAMDALQQFAKKEWNFDVQSFVVTGASKRGWTSWLTAATGDKRVKAIAPIVIDTLNMPVQMTNQVKAFGKPSEMIKDYTQRKLVPIPDTPQAKKLWTMIDPWVYRDRITMPKMIINGTNDPYWPLDALNSYWDDLKGEKWVLYVPNAGHDLREKDANGKFELLPQRAINTLSAFAHCIIFDKKMPGMSWVCDEKAGVCRLEVTSAAKTQAIRVWQAEAPTRDFRQARWVQDNTAMFPVTVTAAAQVYRAFFAETEYDLDGLKFTLSTQIRILEPHK
ncbi:MAG: PhoPQ-activated protein PqaA family protein [Gemmataceae bacterium]|nr:PhoPQ-activated pathogenicity-related family protein [Gemmata sp.]MDW8198880.1 PhoPQ-activated protein PqaA family protein [Gemmataceae bacterium]